MNWGDCSETEFLISFCIWFCIGIFANVCWHVFLGGTSVARWLHSYIENRPWDEFLIEFMDHYAGPIMLFLVVVAAVYFFPALLAILARG
jgi:hypothetical protein